MIKVKVSPTQMEYYESIWPDENSDREVEVTKRILNEFNLSLTLAKEVFENFPDSFEVSGNRDRPIVPSHSRDKRETIFLDKEILKDIDEKMSDFLGGDPYEEFIDIKEDTRLDVFNYILDEHDLNEEDDETSHIRSAIDQYPFGVYPATSTKSKNIEEMRGMLEHRVELGEEVSEAVADFFKSINHWKDDHKTVAYIAAAEILYEHANEQLEGMRESLLS